jgi:predicted porin
MKKTLIASAVAAAALTSNAFAMDAATDLAEKVNSMPTIYGNIQLAHFWAEVEDAAGNKASAHEFADGGSTIGFTHEHMISEGLTGFFKAEFEFDADDKNGTPGGSGLTQTDETYIGVKGDFGSAQVGSDDTIYEQMINITDTSEQIGLNGYLAANGEGDNFQYMGTFDAITVGLTHPIDNTSSTESTQLGVAFNADMFTVAAAYAMSRDANDAAGTKGQDAIGLSASAVIEDLTLQAQFETKDESQSNANDDEDYMAFQALYNMGANTFALGYGVTSYGATNAEDQGQLYLQALHNVSDNMYVYFEYTTLSDVDGVKGTDGEATAIGATYYF